jgi:osmotically-inducible protein OsmY
MIARLIKKKCYQSLFLLCVVLCLGGCMSAVMTGAQLVYDRHEITKDFKNYSVKANADKVLARELKDRRDLNLSVASFNHDLLLVGQVASAQDKERIAKKLLDVPGRRRVFNELEIKPKVSLVQTMKDSWLTAKIRASILANSDINPNDFKVVTEDDVVYVLGDVRKKQGEHVVEIARHTSGVKKVVRIFRYYAYQTRALNEGTTLK